MELINLDKIPEQHTQINEFISLWNNNESSITQYSSGSTGPPKAIEIPKWKMEASARMTGTFLGLNECKSALLCISEAYIGGKMMIVRSMLYNLDLYLTEVNSNPLKDLTSPIDLVAMVPLQVETILEENPEKLNLIKYLIIGGGPVSDHLIHQIQKYSCTAYSTFGMTETVSHIALRKLGAASEPFRAIGNTQFSTQDDCLVIDCEDLGIKGLETTDIVHLIDKKSFNWLGRADFVINSGGVKIHPEEVERKIRTVLNSEDFIIGQLSDQKLGSKVIFIGEEELNLPHLKDKIEVVLDKYERPKAYYFISSLKRTPSGKIDRIKTTLAIQ